MRFQRGFTLIELIIVIVIMSLAAAAFARSLARMPDSLAYDEKLQVGTQLAQAKAEQIRADRWNPSRGFSYITSANYAAESPVSGFSSYSRSVTITDITTNPPCTTTSSGTCKQVLVTVSSGATTLATVQFMVVDF